MKRIFISFLSSSQPYIYFIGSLFLCTCEGPSVCIRVRGAGVTAGMWKKTLEKSRSIHSIIPFLWGKEMPIGGRISEATPPNRCSKLHPALPRNTWQPIHTHTVLDSFIHLLSLHSANYSFFFLRLSVGSSFLSLSDGAVPRCPEFGG